MNMFQEHAAMQANMYGATQAAIAQENASRVRQAKDAQERQHEYQMEMLRQQGAVARQAQRPQVQAQAPSSEENQARNRKLLNMAGMGGRSMFSSGGRTEIVKHPFGRSPFARSLLG